MTWSASRCRRVRCPQPSSPDGAVLGAVVATGAVLGAVLGAVEAPPLEHAARASPAAAAKANSLFIGDLSSSYGRSERASGTCGRGGPASGTGVLAWAADRSPGRRSRGRERSRERSRPMLAACRLGVKMDSGRNRSATAKADHGHNPSGEVEVEVVPAELVPERVDPGGLVDHQELGPAHRGEVGQVLRRDGVAEARVVRAAGMDPGGRVGPEVRPRAPRRPGDRQRRQGLLRRARRRRRWRPSGSGCPCR